MPKPVKKKKLQEDEVQQPFLRSISALDVYDQAEEYFQQLNTVLDEALTQITQGWGSGGIFVVSEDIRNTVQWILRELKKIKYSQTPDQKIIEKRFIFLLSLVSYDILRANSIDENNAIILAFTQFIQENILQPLEELLHIPKSLIENDVEIPKARGTNFDVGIFVRSTIGSIPIADINSQLSHIPPEKRPEWILNLQLEKRGAYERLEQIDPRRAILLKTYLTTDKSAWDVGKEVGLTSRTRSHELLHSSMEIAFYALLDWEREEYGNNPENALKVRTSYQTPTKRKRIKDAHNQRPRNPETGKIEISDIQRKHMKEGAKRRWQQYHAEKTQELPDQQ